MHPKFRVLVVAGMILITLAASSATVSAQASPGDTAAVRDVVIRLFDGMRSRDVAKMSGVFHADAKLYGLTRSGEVTVTAAADFVRGIESAAPGQVLDEVLHDIEVRIDGPLASVWTYYDFFVGDRFSHCGYDAVQLLKTHGEWKIMAIADSRRTEGCRPSTRRGPL